MTIRTAEHQRPTHHLIHISDLHLRADSDGGPADGASHLRRMLEEIEESGRPVDAVVCTGDLADRGEPDAYRMLRAIVDPVLERLGAQAIWVMGDHDDRAAFREHLLDQPPGMHRPVDRVYELGGLRVITLDTTAPGARYGELADAQLDWLAEELATDAPDGTLLAMHHPPLPGATDLAAADELHGQRALAEVVEASDIRSILAGHLHHPASGVFAGIPVSVASSASWTVDLHAPVGAVRTRDGAQSFNLVHVHPDAVLHSVVPVGAFPLLAGVDAAEVAIRLEAAGVRIADPAPHITATGPTRDEIDAMLHRAGAETQPIHLL
ncbi:metallophosphoesterase [Agromyces sp. MMS24-JH15]|uniref:metallophosphoesterase n=1 Tax=Agromyces sp. MMS24-JH15 TaxID=3243765 RepID=UPI00374A1E05